MLLCLTGRVTMFLQSLTHSLDRNQGGSRNSLTQVISVCEDPPVCEVSLCGGLGCWYMMLIRMTTSSVRLTGSETGDMIKK